MNLFSIILIVLILAVAYFHYLQGMFSATLSATLAVIAALLAVSLHEPLAEAVFGGAISDWSYALCLVGLFAIIYTLLRVAFDKLVPGNVRIPPAADKIGGAVMGVIAGMFATGIIAVAAQTLPIGPSIAGYARYRVSGERHVSFANANRQALDATVSGVLEDDAFNQVSPNPFNDAPVQTMLVPVDDLLLGLAARCSDGGSLAGSQPLQAVHPNYLQELFADRVGIQPGTHLTAVNARGSVAVSVDSVFALDGPLRQADVELADLRKDAAPGRSVQSSVNPGPGQVLLVVRTMFDQAAGDPNDRLVRLSTGSVRLVIPPDSDSADGGLSSTDAAATAGTEYYPIGTLSGTSLVMNSRPDDPLFVSLSDTSHAGADFVFLVKRDQVLQGQPDNLTVKDGAFLAVKRMARVSLDGDAVATSITASPQVMVLRKTQVAKQVAVVPFHATAVHVSADPRLPVPINVGTLQDQIKDQKLLTDRNVQWGTVSLEGRAISSLDAKPVGPAITEKVDAQYAVDRLFVPSGQQMAVLTGVVPENTDPWEWARNVGEFHLNFVLPNRRTEHAQPCGAWARVEEGGAVRLLAVYRSQGGIDSIPAVPKGKPGAIFLAFHVPPDARPTELQYSDKTESLPAAR